MKQIQAFIIGLLVISTFAGTVHAIDIETLDKISVHMPKAKVHALLGAPEEVLELGNGLTAEIYKVSNAEPMIGAGCIYQDNRQLAGQAFVFEGLLHKEAAERLVKHGFRVIEEIEGTYRLAGKDDDTGKPLVAQVALDNGMTVIMTFEKDFHEQWSK
ncbi:MAG: hypothetical protein EG822_02720 [Deltaproteobacteria bacterium]|nr:hypothetical protein [Deltaproteobacteria bacterium]TLN00780.1 MAG: hypothetical protein FDZ73_18330 [bacterium]